MEQPTTFLQSANALLLEIERDEMLAPFLDKQFDAHAFAADKITKHAAGSTLERLDGFSASLEVELRAQVKDHHEELFQRVDEYGELESLISALAKGVTELRASVKRISADLARPLAEVRARGKQLERMHQAVQYLRRTLRHLLLTRRVHSHLSVTPPELAKAALALAEIEVSKVEEELQGIHVVDVTLQGLAKARATITSQCEALLIKGMSSKSQYEVATALQVYHNLDCLSHRVNAALGRVGQQVERALHTITQQQPFVEGESNARARAAWWARMDTLLDTLVQSLVEVEHMQRMLSKTRSSTKRASYLSLVMHAGASGSVWGVQPNTTPVDSFWQTLCGMVGKRMAETKDVGLQSLWASEYPRLRVLLCRDVIQRVGSITSAWGAALLDANVILHALDSFEQQFLANSLQRLFDPVAKATASVEEVEVLIRVITQELDTVKGDGVLQQKVTKNVAKAVQLFTQRAEMGLVTDAEAFVISGTGATMAQVHNASIYAALERLSTLLFALSSTLAPLVQTVLSEVQTSLVDAQHAILTPLFVGVGDVMAKTFLTMHREDFGCSELSPSESKWLEALQNQITLALQGPLKGFKSCKENRKQLASRILTLFVAHATSVRPLGEGGKLRLARDAAQVELCVGSITPLAELTAYRALRALRPLLFMEAEEIRSAMQDSSSPLHDIPPEYLLTHLMCRGPMAPRRGSGQGAAFVDWMMQVESQETLIWLLQTLEEYRQSADAHGETEYHPIYPIAMDIVKQVYRG